MPADQLIENDTMVTLLSKAIRWGGANLRDVPPLVKKILKEARWKERVIQQTGEVVKFDRFVDFVTTPPLEGLGADLGLIKRMCEDDKEALDLIDRETVVGQGTRTDLHIDTSLQCKEVIPDGNTMQYAIRKLRKDRPDLHARVLANELSPHAAMIEAGFRAKTLTIQVDPTSAARVIRRHFSDDQLAELINLLSE